jgi:hypothetical protein
VDLLFLATPTAAHARRAIRDSAFALYIVAAVQALAALILDPGGVWDAFIFAGLTLWLHWTGSRIAAIALLLVAASGAVLTIMNVAGGSGTEGGRNVVLALLVAFAALRATVAAFRLPALERAEHRSPLPASV